MPAILRGEAPCRAGPIASAQKREHDEIVGHGNAAALAGQLDLREDRWLLHDSPKG